MSGAERPTDAAVKRAFFERLLVDRQQGKDLPLDHYVELFSGFRATVEEAWEEVHQAADAAAADPKAGLFGPFEVLDEIGRGGQGVVYRARDPHLGRIVALKVLDRLSPRTAVDVERFRREATLTARIDHPGICSVFKAGVEEHTPWIAMRYVQGGTLRDRICELGERAPESTEIQETVGVFESLAHALDAAHSVGVVHRDIKPGNVILGDDGQPVVLDFGLGRLVEGEALTLTGDVFGTPAYMSPEQIAGQRVGIDQRTDLYSLAVCMFEAVTGKRPFDGPTRERLYRNILTSPAPKARALNPAVPRDLEVVLEKALDKAPERRFQSAGELAAELERIRNGRPVRTRPLRVWGRLRRWSRQRPALTATIVVALIALPTVTGLLEYVSANERKVAEHRRAELAKSLEALLADGYLALLDKDDERALALFVDAEQLARNSVEALAGRFWAEMNRGDTQAALACLGRRHDLVDDYPFLRQLLADALEKSGDAEGAVAARRDLGPPSSTAELFVQGFRLLDVSGTVDVQRAASAFRSLRRAVVEHLHAPRPLYHFLLAEGAMRAGDRATCEALSASLARLWPEDPYALVARARLLDRRFRRGHEALRVLRRAAGLRPDSYLVQLHLGRTLLRVGEIDDAIEAFRAAVASGGSAVAWSLLAEALMARGSVDEAESAWASVLEVETTNVLAWRGLARIDLLAGRGERAIRRLAEAKRYVTADWRIDLLEVRAQVRAGQVDLARGAAGRALRHQPDPDGLLEIGRELRELALHEESAHALRRAIGLNPRAARYHADLALTLLRLDDEQAAGRRFRRAVELTPRTAEELAKTGRMLQDLGRLDEAALAWDKVSKMPTGSPGLPATERTPVGVAERVSATAGETAESRTQALGWLRRELDTLMSDLRAGRLSFDRARERLTYGFRLHPSVARLRRLALREVAFPDELVAWQDLWQDVDGFLAVTEASVAEFGEDRVR